jgi:hypothetical protein
VQFWEKIPFNCVEDGEFEMLKMSNRLNGMKENRRKKNGPIKKSKLYTGYHGNRIGHDVCFYYRPAISQICPAFVFIGVFSFSGNRKSAG